MSTDMTAVFETLEATDAEALLESSEGVRGVAWPLRAVGMAGAMLGFVAIAATRPLGAAPPAMPSADLHGLAQKAETHVDKMSIGVFKSPTAEADQCWAEDGGKLVIADCDAKSTQQVFTVRDYHSIMYRGKCLSGAHDAASFVACDGGDERQMFQFPARDSFGTIKNCRCTGRSNCKKSCRSARTLIAQDSTVSLQQVDEVDGTDFVFHRVADEVHTVEKLHLGVFRGPSVKAEKCWAEDGGKLSIAKCDANSKQQAFTLQNSHTILFGSKCLSAGSDGTTFVECDAEDGRQMFQFPARDSFGTIANCRCTGRSNCKKNCQDAEYLTASGGAISLQAEGTDFEWHEAPDDAQVLKLRLGIFRGPTVKVEKCWAEDGGKLVIAACEEASEQQVFGWRDHRALLFDGKCLSATADGASFVECDAEDEQQMFQFPARGAFGSITNCFCIGSGNCKKSCRDAHKLALQGGVVSLQAEGTDFEWHEVEV